MGFFNTDTGLFIIGLIEITGMTLIAISALVYITLIGGIRTLRPTIDGFTINFNLAALFFTTFYLIYYGLTFRDDYYTIIAIEGCTLLYYLGPCANCSVVFSLGAISINRLCMIVFHTRRVFKKSVWMFICVAGSWTLAILVPLPNLVFSRSVSTGRESC